MFHVKQLREMLLIVGSTVRELLRLAFVVLGGLGIFLSMLVNLFMTLLAVLCILIGAALMWAGQNTMTEAGRCVQHAIRVSEWLATFGLKKPGQPAEPDTEITHVSEAPIFEATIALHDGVTAPLMVAKQALAPKESAQPCGCDPAKGWRCEAWPACATGRAAVSLALKAERGQ